MQQYRYADSPNWSCDCILNLQELYNVLNLKDQTFIFLAHKSFSTLIYDNLISQEEKKREKKILRYEDRLRLRTAHTIKRLVCSVFTGINPEDLNFEVDQYNKPHLRDNIYSISFNLSHSGEWCGIAVTHNRPIGFDVQAPVTSENFPFNEIVHPEDCIHINSLETQVLVWAIKEAVTKAHGIGLGYPFNNLRIEATSEKYLNIVRLLGKTWLVRSGTLSDGSAMAVTTNNAHGVKSFQLLGWGES